MKQSATVHGSSETQDLEKLDTEGQYDYMSRSLEQFLSNQPTEEQNVTEETNKNVVIQVCVT